jgi:NADP-dependent 3-hydroxy acid dehydrogenase YdfG
MKKILIIGTSSGVGKASVEYFKQKPNYEVISVSRSPGADIVGDIGDKEFRKYLVDTVTPDILLNCAGMPGTSATESFNVNSIASIDLNMQYYDTMPAGSDIVYVSSIAATASTGWPLIPPERLVYTISKAAASGACMSLSKSRNRDVRVTTLEPDVIRPTDFIKGMTDKEISPSVYENFDFGKFTPIKPDYMAELTEWVINQPRWVTIGRITIMNNYHGSIK